MLETKINNNVLDILRSKQAHLQIEFNKTQEAITALESNPDLIKILDAILIKVLDAIQGGLY